MSYSVRTCVRMLCAAALLCLPAVAARAEDKPAPGKVIDVAICLDTSNSMDGLIASAKVKLWDIVNELARAQPTPDLRVALYSYGNNGYDPNSGWVRKEIDLTNDLDELYRKLNALSTHGGTEYVGRVCRDALGQQKWSDKAALKLIFVCGNEPASQDPAVPLKDLADLAKRGDVIINPIYCGPPTGSDAASWKQLADLAGGKFSSIDQQQGTVAIATPHDKKLAELSVRLNTTYVMYGKDAKEKQMNQVAQDRNAAAAGAPTAAGRAAAKAGALYRNDAWDAVDRMKNDPKFDITKIPEEQLCDELKKLKPAERVAYVKKKAEEREAIQKEIGELSKKRQEYIVAEQKKNAPAAAKALDEALRSTLREQAAPKGIHIPK